jgi:hypothetical protein
LATTRSNRIGRTRIKLAERLAEALTKDVGRPVTVDPADLHSQIPWYARPQIDCCSWEGTAYYVNEDGAMGRIHVASWTQMRNVLKNPIKLFRCEYGNNEYEVC